MLNNKELKVLEEMNFDVNECEQNGEEYVELSQYTPLGEDWYVVIWYNEGNFANDFRDFVNNFDYEEEQTPYIANRGKNGIPNSIKDLLEDGRWKAKILTQTAKRLRNIKEWIMKVLKAIWKGIKFIGGSILYIIGVLFSFNFIMDMFEGGKK